MCLCEKSGTAPLEIFGGALALGIAIFNIADANANTTMETLQARKRPRPVVSCLRCREKKLKCDRVVPCQNCVKSGCRSDCTYTQQPAEWHPRPKKVQLTDVNDHDQDQNHHIVRGTAGIGVIEDLQMRVVKLEELLALRPQGIFGPIRDAPVQSSW